MRAPTAILGTLLAVLSPLVASAAGFAEPSSGTVFERNPVSNGKALVCLGAGVRTYLFWQLYAMDFCMEEAKTKTELDTYFVGPGRALAGLRGQQLAKALRDDPGFWRYLASLAVDKRAEMVFLRAGDADTVRGSFGKNLEKFLGAGDGVKAVIREFVSPIERDVRAGDRAVFVTQPGVGVTFSLAARASVLRHQGAEVKFWDAYLGPDSPLPSLKDAVARGVADLR